MRIKALGLLFSALPCFASLSTSLTLQEALFPGDLTGSTMTANVVTPGGIARTNEPFCMGVPVPDSASLTSTSTLTLSGVSIAQFRILGLWPSGNVKWVKVCGILPSLSAGATASTTFSDSGSSNTSCGTLTLPNGSDTTCKGYGGSNLADDDGTTISVITGGATFTINKAHYRVLNSAVVGITGVVGLFPSVTRGLVLMGPSPTATTALTGTVAENYSITTGVNDTLVIGAQGANPTTVTLSAGAGQSASTIAGQISISGITASASGGHVVLTATTTGRAGGIQIWSGNALATLGFTTGGYSGAVTCTGDLGGTSCTTEYASTNDANSTCVIEENGPVMAVVQCIGNLMDGSANAYMQYTTRQYFYSGSSKMRLVVTLRNANYNTGAAPSADCHYNSGTTQCNGGSFNTAAKGIKSFEVRMDAALSGTLSYDIGTDSSAQTGTISSTDSAYIYQGISNWMVPQNAPDQQYCGAAQTYCSAKYTTDTGFVAKKNSTTLASGDATKTPKGYLECNNGSGEGIEIGLDEFAAMWPGSLECYATNTQVRIGLFSDKNSQNVYMPWPMWKTFETYWDFHTSTPSSTVNNYLKQQHFLLARPSISYFNSTSVWPWPLISGSVEDAYYVGLYTATNPATISLAHYCYGGNSTDCTPDRGQATNQSQLSAGIGMSMFRYWAWSQGGSLNQEEFRWMDLTKFIQRGYTGRFLNSKYFYRYLTELHWAHADGVASDDATVNGFTWRSRAYPEIESVTGSPASLSPDGQFMRQTNRALEFGLSVSSSQQWHDYLHDHTYGIVEYYFNTGDESIKEAIVPEKDYLLNTSTTAYGLSATNNTGVSRAFGVWLLANARYALYAASIGDSSGHTAFLSSGTHQFDNYVATEGCEGGIRPGGTAPTYYPTGCAVALGNVGYVGGGRLISTVNVSGHTVTKTGGSDFDTVNMFSNTPVVINGVTQVIDTVASTTSLSIVGTASLTGVTLAYGGANGWTPGISLERGNHQANSANNYCAFNTGTDSGMLGYYRIEQPFQQAILIDGVLQFRAAYGPSWAKYNRAADLAYGMALNSMLESFADDGTANWSDGTAFKQGFAYFRPLDFPVVCPAGTMNTDMGLASSGGRLYDTIGLPQGGQGLYPTFIALTAAVGDVSWQRKFNIAIQRGSTALSAWLGDMGMPPISQSIYNLANPPSALQDVSFSVMDLGGGDYQLTFTPPAGICTSTPDCLRIKWSAKTIRPSGELLGFDSLDTQTFTYDPNSYSTWFGSNNAEDTSTIPTPTPSMSQTATISTGTMGLTGVNFSVKALSSPVTASTGATHGGSHALGGKVSTN